jgi:hypothetical protein
LACGLGSAQVVVVAEPWLTTLHALIGCSQSELRSDENLSSELRSDENLSSELRSDENLSSELRSDENLSSDLQKTLSNSSLFTLHLWSNHCTPTIEFDPSVAPCYVEPASLE